MGTFETGQVICKEAAATLRALSERLAEREASETATIQWLEEIKPKVQRIEEERDALSARLAEVEAERDSAIRGRNDWRDDYKALSSAIVGETGLSAMTVATQARLFRPRAEAAEAALATARADALREAAAVVAAQADAIVADEKDRASWGGPDPRGSDVAASRLIMARDLKEISAAIRALIPKEQTNDH
jgi:hypothetical protein